MRNLGFFLREAAAGFARGGIMTGAAVLSIAVSMLIIGVFAVAYINLMAVYEQLQARVTIDAYIADSAVAAGSHPDIQAHIEKLEGVADVEYISKEEAVEEFVGIFPGERDLLDYAGDEPLPASFRITVAETRAEPGSVAALAEKIAAIDGIEDVVWAREWLANLAAAVRLVRMAGLVVGGMLAVAAVLVVMSTVALAVYARREQISIMKVVGATDSFINVPFLLEGGGVGVAGGALALAALWGGYEVLAAEKAGIAFLPPEYIAAFVAVSCALGVAGAYISVKRFLKV